MSEEAALQIDPPLVQVARTIPRREARVNWHTPGRVVSESPAPCDMVLNCFVDLLMQSYHRRAIEIIEGAVASGVPLAEVYVRILQPALAEIGRRYEANLATAADQSYAATLRSGSCRVSTLTRRASRAAADQSWPRASMAISMTPAS